MSIGFYTALSTAFVTAITFAIAINTPPISGVFCVEGCIDYPYTDIADRFPRDYFWMYPAMLMMLLYTVLMISIHHFAPPEKKIYSHSGLAFALMSAAVLLINYFVQLSVIQPSIIKGETEGIALLTQYNPHGLFIALEEIGYILMSLSFFCVAPVFSKKNRPENAVRWIFLLNFVLTAAAFGLIAYAYGLERDYLFEVVVISITWLVLVVGGILLSIIFRCRNDS